MIDVMRQPFLPSRRVTWHKVMHVLVNFGFFAFSQPRHPFPDDHTIDCELRFKGAFRSLRVVVNLKMPSITVTAETTNGNDFKSTMTDMNTFENFIGKIKIMVENLPIASPGKATNVESAINIVGEDQ